MVFLYVLAFFTGLLVKFVDTVADEHLKVPKLAEFLAAAGYGLLIGYTIVTFPVIAPLWLGVIAGVALTKKIDAPSHALAVVIAALVVVLYGIPDMDLVLLIMFGFASFIDELVDLHLHKVKRKDLFHKLLDYRLLTEVTALITSLLTGVWAYFLALLSFDIGYKLFEYIYKHT